ncbi:MAG: autotransporter outer membrane beta-barrel domain-containing protein [Rhizomicrobium sp.]
MSKRSLMLLGAATAALIAGQALAQEIISNKVTTPQDTATDTDPGTITITSTGSIVISTNPPVGPAVTIDGNGTGVGSAADVYNQGTISYTGVGNGTNTLTGISMVGGYTGGLDNANKIDFTGSGSYKTGILIANDPTNNGLAFIGDLGCTEDGVLTGTSCSVGTPVSQLVGVQDTNDAAILLETGTSLKIQGDASTAIDIAQGSTLGSTGTPSDIDIAGEILMTPTSSTSVASGSNGLYIAGTMNGDINLIAGGTIDITGTSSYGINIIAPDTATSAPGGVLNGNINIDGELEMLPISTTTQTYGSNIAMYLGGTVNGNIDIETQGSVSATGFNAEGIVVQGPINGYIENQNILETIGTATPSSKGGNVNAGSALVIQASIDPAAGNGGIYNAGPAFSTDTTPNAAITTDGDAPTIAISPNATTPSSIVIGTYTDQGDSGSILNRGSILNSDDNPDASIPATALSISGDSATYTTTLLSDIFNGGTISSSVGTDDKGSGLVTKAVAIYIGPYASVPGILNSNEDIERVGTISASASGVEGGQAFAIEVEPSATLPSIVNDGTISAVATTTNLNLTQGELSAIAIEDYSGTLTNIVNNSGAIIEAIATELTNSDQVAVAIDLESNTSGVTITNNGVIEGDVRLGSGSDNFLVQGNASNELASMTGNIYFGGAPTGTPDSLTIGAYGSVSGQIYSGTTGDQETGEVNILVENSGILNLETAASSQNDNVVNQKLVPGTTLEAGEFELDSGSTTDIHYSQAFMTELFPQKPDLWIINANIGAEINGSTTPVTFTPDSFIAPPVGQTAATFIVINSATPIAISTGANSELSFIQGAFLQNLSYLYSPTQSGLSLSADGDQLILTIVPKTIGADGCKQTGDPNCNPNEIPLTGFAAKMFPYANVALGNDNGLGAAMINGISNSYQAQNAYTEFAPDVSGATRALAVSLTDDATGVVADRQKVLREYANQDGDLTIWGQQFAQRLNQDGTSAGPGYRDTGFGFVMGADEGDPVNGRYGAAFTFVSGGERGQDPDLNKSDSEWTMLTGYTDWRGKGLFLDTDASVGYANLKGTRYISLEDPNGIGGFSDYSRAAVSQHPAEYLAGGATTGVIFNEDGTVITPQVSVNGLVMREEPYNESGGGDGFDLHVASAYEQSLRGFAGLNMRQDFDFTDFLLQPDLTAGYRYDFANGAESVKANFLSVTPPSVFEITGPKPDAGNAVVGGGLGVSTGAWSLNFSFDYLKAGSGNTAEQGTITLLGRI